MDSKTKLGLDLIYNNLNLGNVVGIAKGDDKEMKPSVEWRLHPGTVTAERIIAWIKTVRGIVHFACYSYPQDLHNLLSMVQHESWEKTGNEAEDAKNFERYGPILAEGAFTAIDLFEAMDLIDSASYYAEKLTVIEVKEDLFEYSRVKGYITWHHDKIRDRLSALELEDLDARKDLFRTMCEMWLDENSTPKFDPNDPFWPKYEILAGKDLDQNTVASTGDLDARSDP